jgi:hypothetical protein
MAGRLASESGDPCQSEGMATQVPWNESGPGRVIIRQPGAGAVRLLGLPFLATGGYFVYHLAGGLLHPGELTIAGWILLPIMAAAFFIPGWLLTAFRKRAELDAASREAIEVFDFFLFTHRKKSLVPSKAHVMLRYERGSKRFRAHVYLVAGQAQILLVTLDAGEADAARTLAQRVAHFFDIHVVDQLVDAGEVTSGGVVVSKLEAGEAD